MNLTPENYLFIGSVLLLLSVIASKASYKIGAPMLLLFLGIGLVTGEKVNFQDTVMVSILGELALVFILFSGGLDTKFKEIRPVVVQGVSLSTLGVFLTAFVLGGLIYFISNLSFLDLGIRFSFMESLLLGSIVSSTDAASVFSIFRSKNTRLNHNLRPLLELESGSNDPLAYILTIFLVSYFVAKGQSESISMFGAVWGFLLNFGLGAVMGFVMGKLIVRLINWIRLYVEGLYLVMIVALMAFTFAGTKIIGGNGLLAVYIAGLILGNAQFTHKKMLMKFYEGFAWLMQLMLFITLGIFANIASIKEVWLIGLLISLMLMFIARPVAVAFSLFPFRPNLKIYSFISWVGLRGAVPIVFALIPLTTEGFDKSLATNIFNIVFFISVSSLIFQGTTLFKFAKILGLSESEVEKKISFFDKDIEEINNFYDEMIISEKSPGLGKSLAEIKFPSDVLVVMLKRGDSYVTPKGDTRLKLGDILLVQADTEALLEKARILVLEENN